MTIRKNLLITTLVATILGTTSMQGLAFDFKGVLKVKNPLLGAPLNPNH